MYYIIIILIIQNISKEVSWPLLEKERNINEISNLENFFKNIKYNESLNILILYSKSQCYNCLNFTEEFKPVIYYFKDYVNFYKYDCDSLGNVIKFDKCSQTKIEDFPTIHFYFPELKVYYPYNPPHEKERIFEELKNLKPKNMIKQIEKRLPFYIFNLKNNKELEEYLNKKRNLNKIIYFHNYKYLPKNIKGLSSNFKNEIDFAYCNYNTNKETFFHFGIKETNLPKLMILNLEGNSYNKRVFKGSKTFENYSDFISIFKKKKIVDDYNVEYDKIKYTNFQIINDENWKQYIDRNEIVILHIYDPLIFRYVHLDYWDKIYKDLVKIYDFVIDTKFKKNLINNIFKNDKNIPYGIMLPEGNLMYKLKNFIIFDSKTDLDSIIEIISNNIFHNITKLNISELEYYTNNSIYNNKAVIVLFHDHDQISMGLRKLSKIENYTNYFNFVSIKGQYYDYFPDLKIEKIPKILIFYPVYNNINDESKDYIIEYLSMDEKINYITIKTFLDSQINDKIKFTKKLEFIEKKEDLKNECTNKKEMCILILLSDKYYKENNDELDEINLVLYKIRSNFKNKLNFIMINMDKHTEFKRYFSIPNNQNNSIVFLNNKYGYYLKHNIKLLYYLIKDKIEIIIKNESNLDYFKKYFYKIRNNIVLNEYYN